MIPLKLSLRNFMCYRQAELDLEDIRIACLCGENGAGKSALLDAITWVIWGEARHKILDELVRLGETDMQVELEFLLDGARHRVIRKYARPTGPGRQGFSDAVLSLASNGGFQPLAGGIRETEKKLRELLQIDYETFVRSSFLKQGDSDRFTSADPAERKETLAEILGLSVYDKLEEQAKEQARSRESTRRVLDRDLERLNGELERRPGLVQAFEEAASRLGSLEADWNQGRGTLDSLREARSALEQQRQQLQELQQRLQRTQEELRRLAVEQEQLKQREQGYHRVLEQQAEVQSGYGRFQEALNRREELDKKFQAFAGLQQQRTRLEGQLERGRGSLVDEVNHLEAQRDTLEKEWKALERKQEELDAFRGQRGSLANERQGLQQKLEQVDSHNADLARIQGETAALQTNRTELQDSVRKLQSGQGTCPVCGTPLGQDRCQHLVQDYQSQLQELSQRSRLNQQKAEHLRQVVNALRADVRANETRLERVLRDLDQKIGTIQREVEQAEKAGPEVARVQAQMAALQEKLAQGLYAQEERSKLREVEAELECVDYDSQQHQEARRQVEELRVFEDRRRELEQAQSLLPIAERQLASLTESIAAWRRSLLEDQDRWAAFQTELDALPELEGRLQEAQRDFDRLDQERARAGEQKARAEGELHRLQGLDGEKRQKESERRRVAEEESTYKELAEAFGKRGIQALLIEQAIPEIEQEANRLLARMTDNRMHLKLDTQRQTRGGQIKETLESSISDELGTRSYEMFSGGEAFRIDLALRIALSRLLARRAGAALPVLFIDEGFGTQDSAGRDKLVEAINTVQDEFQKILVITHLEEMKEAFPVRIEVTKGPDGSSISVT